MMTDTNIKSREQAIVLMPSLLTAEDMEEIKYRIEAHAEALEPDETEPFDEWDAFKDYHDASESWADDGDKEAKATLLRLERVLVAVGCYTPISDEDARGRCRSGMGVKMKHFPKIDGQRYEWVDWPK